MATIAKDLPVITLVNVFTVKPENQQQLARLLVEATEQTMKHLPGFVSANIHKSLDGTKVINYAQWRRLEDFEAMQHNPSVAPHMKAATAISKPDPVLCQVVDSIGG
ncbi:MAG: antibiotic biosynthesis monooxygenase family protein [Acidobacteriota bacterium]